MVEGIINTHEFTKSNYFNNTDKSIIRTTPKSQSKLNSKQQNDVVVIDNEPKLSKNKKTLLAVGASIMTALSIVYGVKKYQVKNIKNIQKAFQEIFIRDDITIEQTRTMLNRYKEIEKIKDKEEYAKALFEEVKKNFGMEKSDIKLLFEEKKGAAGFCKSDNSAIIITPNCSRKNMLGVMHHEFRHAKQHELIYLLDPETAKISFLNPKDPEIEKAICDLIDKAGENTNVDTLLKQLLEKYEQKLNKIVQSRYGEIDKNKLTGAIKEFAEKLKKAQANYVDMNDNFSAYFKNFMEVDARWAERKSKKYIKGQIFDFKAAVEYIYSKICKKTAE